MAAIEASGGKALALQADLTQDAEVERVVATTVAQFGRVDVLVANAGGLLQRSRAYRAKSPSAALESYAARR